MAERGRVIGDFSNCRCHVAYFGTACYLRSMHILENGSKLPSIVGVRHDGEADDMVASVAGHWAAVLLYRGDW